MSHPVELKLQCWFNPLMSILKPQINGSLYSNTVIGTLAVDGWAVTFGTARGAGLTTDPPWPLLAKSIRHKRFMFAHKPINT